MKLQLTEKEKEEKVPKKTIKRTTKRSEINGFDAYNRLR